ncbi:PREDICTED: centromere protein X [Nanorana parkeri]|uniref:centromere protein X n=1 Tax=Nanorana parkeri TaxID=125878 RepID=UPI0008547596|nr:PREDICTED: centromere protein X [Nanorana parkeri]
MEGDEEAVAAGFRKDVVSKLLHLYLEEGKTKVSSDAVLVMAELLKVFVTEAAARAARQAKSEDSVVVHIEQVEKILPQLLLDF